MTKYADIHYLNNRFILSGELDFYNVMLIYKKSKKLLARPAVLEFDFTAVKNSDSAGLALILEWIKYARNNNKPITFISLSDKILSLAQASGLYNLIPTGCSQSQ